MWYAIGGMGVLIIYLLIRISDLGYEISKVKDEGFSTIVNDMMDRYIGLRGRNETRDAIERHEREIKRNYENNAYQGLDKQIRNNARYGIFLERDVTIREALMMLYNYLGLEIKPGDDIKIVKSKKKK